MSEPQEFTAQQASDPTTPAQTLADIAALRPDLRPAVAANPSAYPGLLEWLGGLGDPQVDAALAARSAAPAAPPAEQPPAGWQQSPEQAPPGMQPQPYAGQPYQGGQPPAGQPYPGQPYPQPGQPYGTQPYAGTPPTKSNGSKIAIIITIVVVVIIGLGLGAFFLLRSIIGNVADDISNNLPSSTSTTFGSDAPGDDPSLDALWYACDGGDMAACDQLYNDSPFGSEYETFGDTCGGRQDANTGNYCVDLDS
ncbi:hypothetical protein OEB99_06365 [Actinotalea sp. M2MS4P-6]|uniref:variant leucine-rich repeat-containing protein n=1 Tax=Actinotalea sp. M2MS4P-6 TaxID=2983762 RepID=UPI0021E3BC7D|nr:hypothetical protein [Actinotalea sp. M2MS4P-6]MCV2393924.1 hypothetical protein [Actinotalea sp. M2MS4P-6]